MPFVTESNPRGRTGTHLSHRALAALAAGLGLLLLAAGAAALLGYRASVAEHWVDHTLRIREETRALMTTALAAQGSIRGYLLTEDEGFLAPYESAARAVPPAIDQLALLAADNPGQAAAILNVSRKLDALLALYRRMLTMTKGGDRPGAIALVRSGEGEELMGEVRAGLGAIADEERRLLGERRAAADSLRRWTLGLVFGALLAATALAALLGRWMLHYVDRLATQTAALERETRLRRESEATLAQTQKMEAVGQLAGGIAHDFNNMLTIILGNLSTVLRRLRQRGEAEGDIVPPLEAAAEGARGAAKLTHRLLAFSRRQPLAPNQIDLNRVISGVVDLIRRSVSETVELETVLAAGLWPTFADAHQLENVMVNLVVNARDAMPEGGRVTIETGNAYLDDAYAAGFGDVAPGQYVLMSVTDTGEGIPPELLRRVFEPFFTTKREGEGSGLGLAMAHGFVKQSGGHIRIYSELGQGTTVKIYLPRMVDAERVPTAPAEPEEHPAAEEPRGTETILVVEDNAGVRAYARSALEEAGYTVLETASAEEALERLAAGASADLIFTDVVLGRGLNGRELANAVAARGISLPVLFTTGYSRNAIVHNGRLDPGVDLLEKPYTQRDLVRRVRALLNRRPARASG